jgi:hypothetical protein
MASKLIILALLYYPTFMTCNLDTRGFPKGSLQTSFKQEMLTVCFNKKSTTTSTYISDIAKEYTIISRLRGMEREGEGV